MTLSTSFSSPKIATTVLDPGAICVLPASCITEQARFNERPL